MPRAGNDGARGNIASPVLVLALALAPVPVLVPDQVLGLDVLRDVLLDALDAQGGSNSEVEANAGSSSQAGVGVAADRS